MTLSIIIIFLSILSTLVNLHVILNDYRRDNERTLLSYGQYSVLMEIQSSLDKILKRTAEHLVFTQRYDTAPISFADLDELSRQWEDLIRKERAYVEEHYPGELDQELVEGHLFEDYIDRLYRLEQTLLSIADDSDLYAKTFFEDQSLISEIQEILISQIEDEKGEIDLLYEATVKKNKDLLRIGLVIIIVATIILAVVYFTMFNLVVVRLSKLDNCTRKYVPGEPGSVPQTRVHDEIWSLGNSMASMMDRIRRDTEKINGMTFELQLRAQSLQEQHDWLDVTLNSIGDGVIATDKKRKIHYMNSLAEELTGYSQEEAMGKRIDDVLDIPLSQLGKLKSLNGEEEIPITFNCFELEEDFLFVFRDVSELVRLQAQIHLNDKLSSIGLLAAGMAHEINNPIGYIKSNLNTLKRHSQKISRGLALLRKKQLDDREKAELSKLRLDFLMEDLDIIISDNEKGIEKISKIVGDIKGVSKNNGSQYEDVDINLLIEETLSVLENKTKDLKKLDLTLQAHQKVPCIPGQISQVIINLVLNACQALGSDNWKNTEGLICIETRDDENYVICTVSDNGPGIEEEHLKKLFDPFFTTKSPGHGTGLGLNVSYNIVKEHGGELSADNRPEGGAVFTMELPKRPGFQT